jgi:DNA helicase-2/ATP-dependent DNA helicase PcrA
LGQVLDLVLQVMLNPRDNLHTAALAELCGDDVLPGESPRAFLQRQTAGPTSPGQKLRATVKSALEPVVASNRPDFAGLIDVLRCSVSSASVSLDDSEQQRAIGDLDYWLQHWQNYESSCPMGSQLSLRAFRSAMAMGQTRARTAQDGLALSTVHTMKGGETDIVFLMGLCDGTFPDYRAVREDRMNEERNSAFVAVTRVRRWLYITYPEVKRMPWGDIRPQMPSPFYTEIAHALRRA